MVVSYPSLAQSETDHGATIIRVIIMHNKDQNWLLLDGFNV